MTYAEDTNCHTAIFPLLHKSLQHREGRASHDGEGAQPCSHNQDGLTRHLIYKLTISFLTLSGTYWQTHLDNELETNFMSSEHLLFSLRTNTENRQFHKC